MMDKKINDRLARRRWESRQAEIHSILWECEQYNDSAGLAALLRGCLDVCNKRIAEYQQADIDHWNQMSWDRIVSNLLNDNKEEE